MFADRNPIAEFRGPWGVPIQIGASLILLPLLLVDFAAPPGQLLDSVIYVAIIIGSIYLHELGHAWGCLIQGIPVRRILLYGGGGFCERSRSATRWEQELIVAMGPIVTLALWAGAGLIAPLVAHPELSYWIWLVSYVNGFLAVLNLMPVQPLDGGKLFDLMLHRVLPAGPAIRIAGAVGLVVAILWIPMMIAGYMFVGLMLLMVPALFLHWRMLRHGEA